MRNKPQICNANSIAKHKGQYIIASVTKATGVWSVSANPMVQETDDEVKAELERLARLNVEKKFVALRIGDIASLQSVVFE